MSDILLKVEDLKKFFPVTGGLFKREIASVKAVNGVSFNLKKGEVLGLVGETGSGKSTLGRASIRLIEPTEGRIFFEGQDLMSLSPTDLKKMRQKFQMVFQNPLASLNPRKTVLESMGEALLYHGLAANKKEQMDQVADLLAQVGMSADIMGRYPHQFSGGQQQRICIGRALALNPQLIVLDEALSALDVSIQAQILNLLHELKEKHHLSYLFISHDLGLVKHLCDRIIVLYLGKIMEEAQTDELFNHPRHPYTQALLSATPKSHPSDAKHRMRLTGEIPSAMNPPSGCPFRTRCPFAQAICAESPPHKNPSSEHFYDCIL